MEEMISRKMAIDALIACKGKDPFNRYEKQNIGLDWGIEALKQLPSAQPETHEERTETHSCDCISRQAAIEMCREPRMRNADCSDFEMEIMMLPPAQPDLSGYSDKLWKAAYERGKAEALDEIIRCKDCVKHNKGHGYYYDGTFIGIKDCCPLVEIRGRAQGHEFDYQYCAYAERRTDEQDSE